MDIVAEQHRVSANDAVCHLFDRVPFNHSPDNLAVDHWLGHCARRNAVVAFKANRRQIDHLVPLHVVLPNLRHRE